MQTVNLLPNNFNQIIENNYNNNAEYNSETENSSNNIAFLDNQFKKISQVQMAYLEMVKTGIFNLYGIDIRFDHSAAVTEVMCGFTPSYQYRKPSMSILSPIWSASTALYTSESLSQR